MKERCCKFEKTVFMSKEKLKKELHELIDNIEDEALLNIMKEDAVAYQKSSEEIDDLSDLTAEERAELEEMAKEDPDKDSVSFEEYKKITNEWLSKL